MSVFAEQSTPRRSRGRPAIKKPPKKKKDRKYPDDLEDFPTMYDEPIDDDEPFFSPMPQPTRNSRRDIVNRKAYPRGVPTAVLLAGLAAIGHRYKKNLDSRDVVMREAWGSGYKKAGKIFGALGVLAGLGYLYNPSIVFGYIEASQKQLELLQEKAAGFRPQLESFFTTLPNHFDKAYERLTTHLYTFYGSVISAAYNIRDDAKRKLLGYISDANNNSLEIEQLKELNKQEKEKIEILKAELENVKQSIREAEQERDKGIQEGYVLTKGVDLIELKKNAVGQQAELKRLNDRIETLEDENFDLEDALHKSKQGVLKLASAYNDSGRKIEERENVINVLQQENNNIYNAIASIMPPDLLNLNMNVLEKIAAFKNLNETTLFNMAQSYGQLQAQFEEFQRMASNEINNIKIQIEQKSTEAFRLGELLQQAVSEKDMVRKDVEHAKEKLINNENKIAGLEQKLITEENRMRDLLNKFEKGSAAYESIAQQLNEKQITAELASKEVERLFLENKKLNDDIREGNQFVQHATVTHTVDLNKLATELAMSSAEVQQLRNTLTSVSILKDKSAQRIRDLGNGKMRVLGPEEGQGSQPRRRPQEEETLNPRFPVLRHKIEEGILLE